MEQLDLEKFLANYPYDKNSTDPMAELGAKNFWIWLYRYLDSQVGNNYLSKMKPEELTNREYVLAYVDRIKKGEGFIFCGNVGIGKTMLLVYTILKVAEQFVPKDTSRTDFSHCLQFHYFADFLDTFCGGFAAVKYEPPKYLFLDDFGREDSRLSMSKIESLFEKIYKKRTVLVMTTNLKKETIATKQGWERVIDRLRQMCYVVELVGESRRKWEGAR